MCLIDIHPHGPHHSGRAAARLPQVRKVGAVFRELRAHTGLDDFSHSEFFAGVRDILLGG